MIEFIELFWKLLLLGIFSISAIWFVYRRASMQECFKCNKIKCVRGVPLMCGSCRRETKKELSPSAESQ